MEGLGGQDIFEMFHSLHGYYLSLYMFGSSPRVGDPSEPPPPLCFPLLGTHWEVLTYEKSASSSSNFKNAVGYELAFIVQPKT